MAMIARLLFASIIALAVLPLLPNIIPSTYATHTSTPIITTERTEYMVGEELIITGWVEYSNAPASDVLLDITVYDSDRVEIDRVSVRSDSTGNFRYLPVLPDIAGEYIIEVVSHCKDEHRNICTYQFDSVIITLADEREMTMPRVNGESEQQDEMIILRDTMGETPVIVYWKPNDIGSDNVFDVRFIDDESGAEISGFSYNILLLQEGDPIQGSERTNQIPGQQNYTFNEPGQYVLRIEDSSNPEIAVEMPLTVIPEFSVGMLGALAAALGAIVIGGKIRRGQ
jgi:hypothetical protein